MIVTQLPNSDLYRMAELDRTEHITTLYTYANGRLESAPVNINVPPWQLHGDGPHSVPEMMRAWAAVLADDGVLLGALDGERLAGIAVLRPHLTATMAQLAVLYVSNGYRRQGVGRALVAEVLRLARAAGATDIYVSATPSESAVGFYLGLGFKPTDMPHPALFAEEPEDIHMIMPL